MYIYFEKSFSKQTQTANNYLPCQNIATILVTPLIRSSHFLSRSCAHETDLEVSASRMYTVSEFVKFFETTMAIRLFYPCGSYRLFKCPISCTKMRKGRSDTSTQTEDL